MATKTFNFSLPFFSGFYESEYEYSDTEYYAITEEIGYFEDELGKKFEYNDFTFDYKTRRQDIVESFVEVFYNLCPDWVEKVEFDELVSPKYYNYATDRIFANVTLSDEWREKILDFIKENYDELKKHIRDEWTSYDGFISFMENDIEEWVAELKKDEPDERYVSSLIGYYIAKEHDWKYDRVREELYELTMCDIYDGAYVHLNDECDDENTDD